MTTKYVARLDGKIVGKRTSATRTYTHAVVGQLDEAHARDAAYNYVPTKTDRSNYDFAVKIAACEGKIFALKRWEKEEGVVGQVQTTYGDGSPCYLSFDAERIAEAKAETANGWEGFVALRRAKHIEGFERDLTNGAFKPKALTWCGRPDLAQKEASQRRSRTDWYPYSNVWIVPAEVA